MNRMPPMLVGQVCGAMARPGNTSRHSAAPAPHNTGGRCKCVRPCVTHGPPCGRNGTLSGTNGHHTPNSSCAPCRTTKNGCAHTSSSPRHYWTPSPNRSATGSPQWLAFFTSGRYKAFRSSDVKWWTLHTTCHRHPYGSHGSLHSTTHHEKRHKTCVTR